MKFYSIICATLLLGGCAAQLTTHTSAERYYLSTDYQGWKSRSKICAQLAEQPLCHQLIDGIELRKVLGSNVLTWADKARANNPSPPEPVQQSISSKQANAILKAMERDALNPHPFKVPFEFD